jgi:hypothetical protein
MTSNFEQFRKSALNKKLQENNKQCINDMENETTYIKTKLCTLMKNNNLEIDEEDILYDFKDIPNNIKLLIACYLKKDPLKQGFDEITQREYFNMHNKKYILKKPSGKEDICFNKSTKSPIPKKDEKDKINKTKTFDGFLFEKQSDKLIAYVFQKHTKVAGGAQDNQVADVEEFIRYADAYISKSKTNIKFLAIIDGNYGIQKLPSINTLISNKDMVYALTSDEFLQLFS